MAVPTSRPHAAVDRGDRSPRTGVTAAASSPGSSSATPAYYLVRNNLALAIPDILREYPQHSKAELGLALTGLSLAYGALEVPDGVGVGPQQSEILPAARPAAVVRASC